MVWLWWVWCILIGILIENQPVHALEGEQPFLGEVEEKGERMKSLN